MKTPHYEFESVALEKQKGSANYENHSVDTMPHISGKRPNSFKIIAIESS
jgi:hypothetical protein